jgi:hypothetical protein
MEIPLQNQVSDADEYQDPTEERADTPRARARPAELSSSRSLVMGENTSRTCRQKQTVSGPTFL